jgi:hypothetical protein
MFFLIAVWPGGAGNGEKQLCRECFQQVFGHRCFAGAGRGGNDDEFVLLLRHVQRKGKISN